MPRLRRLNGPEVIGILTELGFEVVRIRGSHHRLRLAGAKGSTYLTVPAHGKHTLSIKTLKTIYRQACERIPEEQVKSYFFED